MRCKECNVDLGEQYTVCPLCGNKAIDEPAKISGFETAEFPKTYKPIPKKVKVKRSFCLSKEKLKAVFNL